MHSKIGTWPLSCNKEDATLSHTNLNFKTQSWIWVGGKNNCMLVICHYYCRSVAPVSSSVFFLCFSQYLQQSGPNGARQMGFSRHFDHEVEASQYIESVLFSSSGFLHDCTVPSERNCKPAKTEFGRVELWLTPGYKKSWKWKWL